MGDSPPVASLEQRYSHDVQDCNHQCPPCLCILGSPGCRIWSSSCPPCCLPPALPTSDSSFCSNPIGLISICSSIKFCLSFSSLSWSCPICSCSFSYSRGFFSLCKCTSIFCPCSFTTGSFSFNTISCSSTNWTCSFPTICCSSSTNSCPPFFCRCSFFCDSCTFGSGPSFCYLQPIPC